jgi:hypothetical protein
MHQFKSDYLAHQLKRFMQPDAHRYIRPDWRRYVRPGHEDQVPFARFERKYNPGQPRVPAGAREGGQWTGGDGSTSQAQGDKVAQVEFGNLIAELRGPTGRRCVYKFNLFTVIVPGPTNFSCPKRTPSAATSHGVLTNDN